MMRPMGGGGMDAVTMATAGTPIGCLDRIGVSGWLKETRRDIPSIGGTRRVVGTAFARDSDVIWWAWG